jgi:hypothetical protein
MIARPQHRAGLLILPSLTAKPTPATAGNAAAIGVSLCRESVAINSSLMTLARCLEVLRYNQQHTGDQKVIPYRESKVWIV